MGKILFFLDKQPAAMRLCNLFKVTEQVRVELRLKLLPNTSSCAQCTMRPNNTKTSEFGAEKGLLQGHARRWLPHAPPKP